MSWLKWQLGSWKQRQNIKSSKVKSELTSGRNEKMFSTNFSRLLKKQITVINDFFSSI